MNPVQLGTNLTSITLYLMVIAVALLVIAAKLSSRKTRSEKKK